MTIDELQAMTDEELRAHQAAQKAETARLQAQHAAIERLHAAIIEWETEQTARLQAKIDELETKLRAHLQAAADELHDLVDGAPGAEEHPVEPGPWTDPTRNQVAARN